MVKNYGSFVDGSSSHSNQRRTSAKRRRSGRRKATSGYGMRFARKRAAYRPIRRARSKGEYARLILPHVGLILLSCIYILAGAAVFYFLEKPHENIVRETNLQTVSSHRQELLSKMWELSEQPFVTSDDFRDVALEDIDNMTRVLFRAFDTHYITADELNANQSSGATWTFLASVFFTSTLLTTIGYGNLVPVTFEGRMFCICYGLFGVPLILITVADIGKFLSEHIVWMYCRYLDLKRKLKKRWARRQASEFSQEQEDAEEAAEEMRHELEKFGLDDYISIPVSLVLVILVGYIGIGAILLSNLEEWNFFSAFYFSFITMTTVGFGDIVPEKESYYLLDLLYIIIGLAITTMCIDLVGIQYIRKIHYFGRAIQDARYALVNVGGKMVHVGDLMKYASVLHKKYGIGEGGEILENPMTIPSCYIPKEIKYIRYIDYLSSSNSRSTSGASLHTICSRSFASGGDHSHHRGIIDRSGAGVTDKLLMHHRHSAPGMDLEAAAGAPGASQTTKNSSFLRRKSSNKSPALVAGTHSNRRRLSNNSKTPQSSRPNSVYATSSPSPHHPQQQRSTKPTDDNVDPTSSEINKNDNLTATLVAPSASSKDLLLMTTEESSGETGIQNLNDESGPFRPQQHNNKFSGGRKRENLDGKESSSIGNQIELADRSSIHSNQLM